jgi:hypothetical protein
VAQAGNRGRFVRNRFQYTFRIASQAALY